MRSGFRRVLAGCSMVLLIVATVALPRTVECAGSGGPVIGLILDASGSMNARLPSGTSRIAAARAAVERIVEGLPPGTTLGLRAYGHQSPREKHDCNDTDLLVPFGDLADVKRDVVARANGLTARGYTPITRVITLAANELPPGPGKKAVILVSDGQETCEGDPCAAVKALKEANAELVIHTIGFDVDVASRTQLQCIANAAGGSYADVSDADQLVKAVFRATEAARKAQTQVNTQAVKASETPAAIPTTVEKIVVKKPTPGKLEIKWAELQGHDVIEVSGGQVVAKISSSSSVRELPAGLYNVTFGKGLWKSVEVEPGKTTTLAPALLEVKHAGISGHEVRNSETGSVEGTVSSLKSSITLLPGCYDVSFGNITWPLVKAEGGVKTVLDPGTLEVKGANIRGHAVRTSDGNEVGKVSATGSTMALPPGSYTVELGEEPTPFQITEGKQVLIEVTN